MWEDMPLNTSRVEISGNLNITGATLGIHYIQALSKGVPYVVARYGTLTGKFAKLPDGFTVDYAYNDGLPGKTIAIMMPLPPQLPEIAITQGKTNMTSGSSKIALGAVTLGNKVSRTFTIKNTGKATLNKLAVSLSGTGKAAFTTTKPVTSLAPGKTATFKVTFSPTKKGKQNVQVKIASNDADEASFIIKMVGKGQLKKAKANDKPSPTLLADNAKDAKKKKTAGKPEVISQGTVLNGGEKFLTLTVRKTTGVPAPENLVEVSPDLLDWSSGPNHVTVVSEDAETITVRDNVPTTATSKRFIRLGK